MNVTWNPATRRWLFGVVCVVAAVWLTSRGLGDETFVSTHGDPPRYMMNAMFMLDLLRDHPFGSLDELREYSTLYYARYPALSLGHHPPFISMAQVPFLAILGPSITVVRLPIILMFAAGVLCLHLLVTDLFDEWAGGAAGLVMAASPSLVYETQAVLSDSVAAALTVVAAYCLHRYLATERRAMLVGFVLAAVCAVLAKPNAVVAYPAFLAYATARLGWRRLLQRDFLVAGAAIGLLAGGFVGATIAVSDFNVGRSTQMIRLALFRKPAPTPTASAAPASAPASAQATVPAAAPPPPPPVRLGPTLMRVAAFTPHALAVQLSAVTAFIAVGGLLFLVGARGPAAWLFGVWAVTAYVFVALFTQRVEMERYGAYWLPSLAAGVGWLTLLARQRSARGVVAAAVVTIALLFEVSAGAAVRVHGLSGYEEAARYVQEHPRGTTVMFSGDFDTGYFVFFTRKHDPGRRAIVLRSDKIFTVSSMRRLALVDLIDSPASIAPTFARLGTGYIVIEDQKSQSPVLEWVRQELHSDRYIERLRVPIDTRDLRLQHTDIVVYEPTHVSDPAPDARLDLRLPLVSKQFDVPLADLIARKHLP